jgi:EmrB/QacA subfamily drug resistance transporter
MSFFKNIKVIENKSLPLLAALTLFMQTLDATILNTALPSIAKELGQSPLMMQSIIVSYTVTLALFIPISGWLSSKYGTKNVFILAVILFTLGSLCCAMANTLLMLNIARILQGIGGAMMVPVARLAVLYAYPKELLLKVLNLVTVPGLIGPVIGPSLGGLMVDYLSWHWIFLINIPIGIIGVIVGLKVMPNFKQAYKPFDNIGFVYFSSGIMLLTLFLELSSMKVLEWYYLFALMLIAIIMVSVYVNHAFKINNPLLDLKLFAIRTFKVGMFGSLFTRLGIGGVPMLLPLLFQVGLGFSPTIAGMMLLPSAIATILTKSFVVPLVRKFGYKNILITNTVLLAISIGLLAIPGPGISLYYYVPVLLLYGAANSIQLSSMNTLAISDLSNQTAGDGNSMLSVMQQLSITVGVSFSGFLLTLVASTSAIPEGNSSLTFRIVFIVLSIVTLFSTLLFFKLKSNDGDAVSGYHIVVK